MRYMILEAKSKLYIEVIYPITYFPNVYALFVVSENKSLFLL